jgi:hypothetical protein
MGEIRMTKFEIRINFRMTNVQMFETATNSMQAPDTPRQSASAAAATCGIILASRVALR